MTTATSGVVFYDDPSAPRIPPPGEHWKYLHYGRCKSGRQWFWCTETFDYGADELRDLHGYAASEEAAITAARAACTELAAGQPAGAAFRAGVASRALKRVNAAKRRARPPSGDRDARPVEYLYVPWTRYDYDYGTRSAGIDEIPIVKKTPKRVYYEAGGSWDKYEQVHTLAWIDREELETDTRCKEECPRTIPVPQLLCAPHGSDFAHCVHFGQRERERECWMPPGCADACPVDTHGAKCGRHGYTFAHCPHGHNAGRCPRGSPAGQAGKHRDSSYHGSDFYTTCEAAQAELDGYEKHEPADLRELRMAMADAHPDRGGTAEAFMAARQRYKRAEARAGK
jgi:hypothetical protein